MTRVCQLVAHKEAFVHTIAHHADGRMQDDTWQERLAKLYGELAGTTLSFMHHYQTSRSDETQIISRVPADLRSFLSNCVNPEAILSDWQKDPSGLELLLRLGHISRYGFHVACRHPDDFIEIVNAGHHRQVWGNELLADSLLHEQAGADLNQRRRILARFKHRHFLRLILGDMTNSLSFEALVIEMSDVVDVLIQSAFAMAEHAVNSRFEHIAALPPDQRAFAVLAMGKHGARELNYSSDIDLIFLYKEIEDSPPDYHEYHQRIGQEMIQILENPADDGRLFRIDMRLRPEGDRGELALSLRETYDYYYSVGRAWERQAMIKARPVAGNLTFGQKLIEELQPWIYPKDPEWETLDDARSMRRRIEERAQESNIKTGAGGIRDIEFLVQYFQLAYGGRLPELRERATLPTLHMLTDRGFMPPVDARQLEDYYIWLRTVEHRMQMWDDRQEHDMPAADDRRTSLAHRCGYKGRDALERFDRKHARVRTHVREIVGRHFLTTTQEDDAMMALVVQGEADDKLTEKYLEKVGFKDIKKACYNLRQLAEEPFFVLSRSRTERSLVKIMPLLLHLIGESPNPDFTLENFVEIVHAVGGRSTFYELLGMRADILTMFADLAGWSRFLIQLMHDFPGLPDEVIDTLNKRLRSEGVLAAEARTLIAGLSNPGEPLAFMVARETAATAMRDLEGITQRDVGEQLTATASAVFNALLPRVIADRAAEWGIPMEGKRPTRFAVLGLGKLGSKELTYASDMDVIFVSDPGGHCPKADYDGDSFWLRIAQTLMRIMHEAHVYEVDPRLRPWGDGGPMVANTEALKKYWEDKRDVWERMAMLRVSYLAGDPQLANEAISLIRSAAFTQPIDQNSRTEVRDMRVRLEDSVAGRDHVKRGWGGYVDHEFIAQFVSLGLDPSQMPIGCATEDMIARLGDLGRIPLEAVEELTSSLHTLRFAESRMRLAAGKAISSLPKDTDERTLLARRCDYADLDAFNLSLHVAREIGRRWYDRLV